MKVKMLEYYQGADVEGVMEPGREYDVNLTLGSWLVDNRKAVEVDNIPFSVPSDPPAPVEGLRVFDGDGHEEIIPAKFPEPQPAPKKRGRK